MAFYKYTKNKNKRRGLSIVDILVAILVIGLALYFSLRQNDPQTTFSASGSTLRGRASVSDGDTIRIRSEKIRLVGIDAPELHQNCGRKSQKTYACGKTSRSHLIKLINNREVECRWTERDQYHRPLAYCFVGDEESLNRQMVLDGWAISYNRFPHEEADAKQNKRGLWESDFERPRNWRDEHMTRP